MKQYILELDDELSEVYEDIAKLCGISTEEILQDTLHKVVDMIGKTVNEECKSRN